MPRRVGYGGPARLARTLRVQRVLPLARTHPAVPRLADLAVMAGYADQQHLTHELRAIVGPRPPSSCAPVMSDWYKTGRTPGRDDGGMTALPVGDLPANLPAVVSRKEWLAARKRLLAEEKRLTRARDSLNAQRRRLPLVRIDKEYVFDAAGWHVISPAAMGPRRRSQLIALASPDLCSNCASSPRASERQMRSGWAGSTR